MITVQNAGITKTIDRLNLFEELGIKICVGLLEMEFRMQYEDIRNKLLNFEECDVERILNKVLGKLPVIEDLENTMNVRNREGIHIFEIYI